MSAQVVTQLKHEYAECEGAAVLRQVPAMFSVAHKDPAANGVMVIRHINKYVNS